MKSRDKRSVLNSGPEVPMKARYQPRRKAPSV
eukprot:CAMPEP_0205909206 /NCGR_PEP_ID=MMETSP1325-20131115/3724_1 /ASSEMBLY_ACC=CAM_ASM_000708 /TAXON_ID=236786 /ORGANISM="Florenciella sp., Strain RCC1007" /LENGTH=31 /DNA_ID= /DNA_START= /DNA_END= /DNA_ORIENTATION=